MGPDDSVRFVADIGVFERWSDAKQGVHRIGTQTSHERGSVVRLHHRRVRPAPSFQRLRNDPPSAARARIDERPFTAEAV